MLLALKILDIIFAFTNIIFVKNFLHLYQLKDYNNTRYLQHLFCQKLIYILVLILLTVVTNLILNSIFKLIIFIFSIILNIIFNFKLINSKKTPIKYTNKLKRLYLISSILMYFSLFFDNYLLISQILLIIIPILANFLNFYDKIKNFNFIKSAQQKLKNNKTKIIAITGSNGKTSVKNILLSLLSTQYKVQATPASYNTPLGISKFINDELKSDCEFVILEYGARHKNDVKNLCKIFGADYGIVTTISPQHLQTFKCIENIVKAKNELPKFLKNKPCVFNVDNKYCRSMFDEKVGEKICVSLSQKADIFASKISNMNFQTKFRLHTSKTCSNITTNLLGKHNVINTLLASALALELGVKIENIVDTISSLQPTQHRLEHIKSHINILDDSYNCSIESAKQAIDVLSSTTNKKMVVTPGIIEGGKNQFKLNYKLGRLLKNLDYVIIIGETNKKAILSGIKSHNYKCKIITSKSLDESKQYFQLLNKDDCLLLLNDLPDDYN